jgi:integrase
LTAVAVERLKPPLTGRVEYWDAALPGFGLRITEHGKRSWVLMTRLRGQLLRYTIGSYPKTGLAKARELARSALHLVAEGKDPRDERKRRDEQKPGTFAHVAAAFLERGATQKAGARWASEQARIIHRELIPRWGTRPITAVTRRDVIETLDRIAKRAPVQANRTLAVVQRLFAWAVNSELAPGSPCVRLERPGGRERARERVQTMDELRALWIAWDAAGIASPGTRSKLGLIFGVYFKTLLLTVQRRGEVAGMRWTDLNLDAQLWTIPTAKGGHAHEVPLAPAVVALLRGLPQQENCPYVFTTNGRTPISGFSKATAVTAEAAKVTGWRLHDLRRSAATEMAKRGIPKATIRRVLGHAEADVTEVYVRHSWIPEKRAALEEWARFFMAEIRRKRA